MIFYAKNYNTRSDIENDVRNKLGLTAELKPMHEIRGTKTELKKLQLSDTTIFWGLRCVIVDEAGKAVQKPPTPQKERPQRGEIHKSKLDILDINNSNDV